MLQAEMDQMSNHEETSPTSMDKPLMAVVIKKRERTVEESHCNLSPEVVRETYQQSNI